MLESRYVDLKEHINLGSYVKFQGSKVTRTQKLLVTSKDCFFSFVGSGIESPW